MLYPKIYLSVFAFVTILHVVVFSFIFKEAKAQEIIPAIKKSQAREFSLQTVKIKLKPKVEEFVELAKTEVKREVKKIEKKSLKNIKKVEKKKKIEKKKIEKPIPPQKIEKAEVVEEVKKVAEPMPVETKTKEDNKADSASNQINKEMLRYLKRLQYEMEKRKVYPSESKKLKHEGTVVLSFVVQKNGQITNMNVVKDCLHPKLNEAALGILKKLQRFEPIPDNFNKSSWAIQVPVKYKIINEF